MCHVLKLQVFSVSLMHTCIIDNNCNSLFHIHIVRIDALRSVITRHYRGEGIFQFFYFFKDIGKIWQKPEFAFPTVLIYG